MNRIILILSLLLIPVFGNTQDTINVVNKNALYGLIVDGDTIIVSEIEEVVIIPKPKFSSRRDLRRYRRLVRNVKVVYPYAKLAKRKYDEVVVELAKFDSEKARKDYMKQVEQELKDEFEGDLKKLTISQGRILIKLIDREIGETSYVVLKEFRGTFSAFFWQTIARLFGHNLKAIFDADGEDKLLNDIIILIENGQL